MMKVKLTNENQLKNAYAFATYCIITLEGRLRDTYQYPEKPLFLEQYLCQY